MGVLRIGFQFFLQFFDFTEYKGVFRDVFIHLYQFAIDMLVAFFVEIYTDMGEISAILIGGYHIGICSFYLEQAFFQMAVCPENDIYPINGLSQFNILFLKGVSDQNNEITVFILHLFYDLSCHLGSVNKGTILNGTIFWINEISEIGACKCEYANFNPISFKGQMGFSIIDINRLVVFINCIRA